MKTKNEIKKAILFARVSTVQQNYDEQINESRRAAIADGYKESEIVIVKGKESAIKLAEEERVTLNEMKELISQYPTIESIYIFAIDRLARRVSVVLSVKDYLLERKINLVFLHPYKLSTMRNNDNGEKAEDELTSMFLMYLAYGAEMEMKIKQARFKAGKAHAKKQGKFIGGTVMFGFCKDENGKLIVNESEAAVIKTAFEMYRDNKSKSSVGVEAIAQYLRDNNVCRRGKFFAAGRLNKFIKQEKYRAIVGAELFDECQQILTENYNGAKERRMAFGERLIKCPECGHNFRFAGKMYECAAHKQEYKNSDMYCDNKTHINRQMLDCTLVETVSVWWLEEKQKESVDRSDDIKRQLAETEKKLSINAEKMEKVSQRKKRTAINYANMLIDDDEYSKQVKGIEKDAKQLTIEKEELESRIRDLNFQLKGGNDFKTWADYIDDFDSLTHKELYEVIHKLVDRVEVKTESKTKTVWTIYRRNSSDSYTYFAEGWGKTRKLYGVIGGNACDLSSDERFNIDYDVNIKRQPKQKQPSPIMQMWQRCLDEARKAV